VTLEVRPLEEAELDRVAAAIPARAPEQHRRRLRAQASGGAVYLVGWLDGEPVGFVMLGLHDDRSIDETIEARGYALVHDLWVEVPHRRRGVARALMRELEDRARAAGMPGVILDTGTTEDFAAARALYRDLGYDDQGGVYLGGWSDPDHPGIHFVDPLTTWRKPFTER
jgi:GNAT superfamily N-acetyltransferase